MKQFFLTALLATASLAANAQSIAAGTIALGGGVGYSSFTTKDGGNIGITATTAETKQSRFTLTPSVGYFVADNLAVGLNLGYTASRYTVNFTPARAVVRADLDPSTELSIGLYAQYYKMLTEQFGVLGTLGGGYQNTRDYKYADNSSSSLVAETKGSGYYAGLIPGVIFFPIPKLGISASVGSLRYSHISRDFPTNNGTKPDNYESTASTLGLGFGLDQLQFGGTYYFGR